MTPGTWFCAGTRTSKFKIKVLHDRIDRHPVQTKNNTPTRRCYFGGRSNYLLVLEVPVLVPLVDDVAPCVALDPLLA